MLPVTLASADANDNSELGSRLPHNFSTMFCFSPEAIDITAALARCAISRTELAGAFAAGFASADFVSAGRGGAGILRANCVEAASFFGASAAFATTTVFGASASFGASTGFDPSASLGGSTGGDASATREGSPCGAEAANLSLNIIEADVSSGFESILGGGREANTSLNEGASGRAATAAGRLTTGAS